MSRSLSAAVVLAIAFSLTGCVAIGGTSNVQKPTTGQQLIDLKSALDKGALTQAEYDKQKAELLNAKN